MRSKAQRARMYVYLPAALAKAIGMEAGEEVSWELLDRGELHLVRHVVSEPTAKRRAPRQPKA
jgi:antitoxin component of MazEF toxin-antitoxin module